MKIGTLINNEKLDECVVEHNYSFGHNSYTKFVDQTIEEMAELTQALLKIRRNILYGEKFITGDLSSMVDEEIADVLICLEALCRARQISNNEMAGLVDKKINKWYVNRVQK
jgi:NTP pyrophosphatase (non-canonical NTP hydrolase)